MKKLFFAAAVSFSVAAYGSGTLDTAKIDSLTGLKGKLNEKEGVYKVTLPRARQWLEGYRAAQSLLLRPPKGLFHAHRRPGNDRAARDCGAQALRQDQRSSRGESGTERCLRRNCVAGEKFDFGGTAKQSLRRERRSQQWNGEIHHR